MTSTLRDELVEVLQLHGYVRLDLARSSLGG
jgi:hypothetical protein